MLYTVLCVITLYDLIWPSIRECFDISIIERIDSTILIIILCTFLTLVSAFELLTGIKINNVKYKIMYLLIQFINMFVFFFNLCLICEFDCPNMNKISKINTYSFVASCFYYVFFHL